MLPNITGTFGNCPWDEALSGALALGNTIFPVYDGIAQSGTQWNFQASRSNALYSKSSTVQPASVTSLVLIKI